MGGTHQSLFTDLTNIINNKDFTVSYGSFICSTNPGNPVTLEIYTGQGFIMVTGMVDAANAAWSKIMLAVDGLSVLDIMTFPLGIGQGNNSAIIPFKSRYEIYGLINNAGDSLKVKRYRWLKT